MKSEPTQRLNILTDVYRLLLDGLHYDYRFLNVFCLLEVLLNSRAGLVDVLIESGILSVLGDVVVSETDPVALVCFPCSVLSIISFSPLNYPRFSLTVRSFMYRSSSI